MSAAMVDVEAFTGRVEDHKPRKRARTISARSSEESRREAEECMRSADWSAAGPRVFVAAYEVLHERVYKAAAGLTSRERMTAQHAAARVLRDEFGGDPAEMAVFLRWAWQREAWLFEQGKGSSRLTWFWLFCSRKVSDYRVHAARESKRAKR